jgi:hypothetical protein
MEFQPGHPLQWIHAEQLADPPQPVIDAASVQVEFRGDVLDRAVGVVEEFQDREEFAVAVVVLKLAEIDGPRVNPRAGPSPG